jgi:hypothetical protein
MSEVHKGQPDSDDSLPPAFPLSAKALGKRRALDDGDNVPEVRATEPNGDLKRLRRATASPSPPLSTVGPSKAIDLTESDEGVDVDGLFTDDDDDDDALLQLHRHTIAKRALGNETPTVVDLTDEEPDADDDLEVLVDAAKARHAATFNPGDIVDLTGEESQSPERDLGPVAGPSSKPIQQDVGPVDSRHFLSEISCPICMTCLRRAPLRRPS